MKTKKPIIEVRISSAYYRSLLDLLKKEKSISKDTDCIRFLLKRFIELEELNSVLLRSVKELKVGLHRK